MPEVHWLSAGNVGWSGSSHNLRWITYELVIEIGTLLHHHSVCTGPPRASLYFFLLSVSMPPIADFEVDMTS